MNQITLPRYTLRSTGPVFTHPDDQALFDAVMRVYCYTAHRCGMRTAGIQLQHNLRQAMGISACVRGGQVCVME